MPLRTTAWSSTSRIRAEALWLARIIPRFYANAIDANNTGFHVQLFVGAFTINYAKINRPASEPHLALLRASPRPLRTPFSQISETTRATFFRGNTWVYLPPKKSWIITW